MLNIKIKDFAVTGKFGPISLGDSRDKIVSLFGVPTNEAFYGEQGSEITYGWYEFFLDQENILYAMQNDSCYELQFANEKISITPWLLNDKELPTFEEVVVELKSDEIDYETFDKYGRKLIRLSSGFTIDFDEEAEDVSQRKLSAYLFWPER